MTSAEALAAQLRGAKRSGKGWVALCPAHDDHNPSLKLDDGQDGRLLWHCFAGCSQDAVRAAREHRIPGYDQPPAEALARQLFRLSAELSGGDVNGALGSLRDVLPRARDRLAAAGADENPEDEFFARHTDPLTALGVMVKRCERQIAEVEALATPLDTLTLGELWEQPEPEVTWLVDGLLPQDGLSLLVAPPKAGKSTLVRCLAVTVAKGGGKWLGRTTTGGRVLHLALEERSQTVSKHYRRLEADPAQLHVMFGPPPQIEVRGDMLRGTIRKLEPALVIVDTLARWSPTEDANHYSQVNPAMDPFIEIARELCTHVVLVHHSRKSGGEHGQEALGSTSFAASVDTILSIKRKGNERTIASTGRDGADMEETVLAMDSDGWVSAGDTKREADQLALDRRIVEWLEEQDGPVTTEEIRTGLSAGKQGVVAALNRLVREGKVMSEGEGKRGDPVRYSVSVPAI